MLCYTIETIITLSIVCVIFPQTETTLAKCGYSLFDLKISYLGFGRKSLENFTLTDCRPDQCVSPFCQGVLDTQPNPHITDFCEWEQFILVCFFSSLESQKKCLLTTYWDSYSISSPEKSLMTATLGWKAPPNSSQQKSNKISVDDRVVHACLHAPGWQLNSSSKIGDREILSVTF